VDRRTFVATLSTPGAAPLAGCTVGYAGPSRPATLAELGRPPTICEEDPLPNLIAAVDDPVFGRDWDDPRVPEKYTRTGGPTDDRQGICVARDGRASAYPLAILRRHEVVNDRVGGPLLVTYCPLCRSGLVARREVRGEPTTLSVSGLLWKPPDAYTAASAADGTVFVAGEGLGGDPHIGNTGSLVLTDAATNSRWSQIFARAICGPPTGSKFEPLPSTVTTWGEWRAEHPGAEVLLPPPVSGTV